MSDALDPDDLERRGLVTMADAVRKARRLEADEKTARDNQLGELDQQTLAVHAPEGAVVAVHSWEPPEHSEMTTREDATVSAAPAAVEPGSVRAGGFFVWVRGDDWRGAVMCEKWAADIPCGYLRRDGKGELVDHGRVLVAKYPIAAIDMARPLFELAAIFPCPAKEASDARPGRDADGGGNAAAAGRRGDLPDPQDGDGAGAGAHRGWEDAVLEAVLSRLPLDRRARTTGASGTGFDRHGWRPGAETGPGAES